MDGIFEFLVTNPIVLFPALLMLAMLLFALLKRLLKMAAIVAIAGVLYVLLMEYVGPGF